MRTLYAYIGTTEYYTTPRQAVPIARRERWEFIACLEGEIRLDLPREDHDEVLRGRTLWCLPAQHPHGWLSDAPCVRAIFHFRNVPPLLEHSVPARGYYRVALKDTDCNRIRVMAAAATEANKDPSERIHILGDALTAELSLMALREVPGLPLSDTDRAHARTEQALRYFTENMARCPRLGELADAAHVSVPYLRQLFYKAHKESPKAACTRIRMQRVQELLTESRLTLDVIAEQVGLSSASALSRAIKTHFGTNPRQLRQ